MDAVDREEMIGLLAEALMRKSAPRGGIAMPHFVPAAATGPPTRIAAGLVEHLYRCGIRWSRLPPAPPHRTSA
jgi:hypothetical protein